MLLEAIAHLLLAALRFCAAFLFDVVVDLCVEVAGWAVARAVRSFGLLQNGWVRKR